jgi:hypothetical protein
MIKFQDRMRRKFHSDKPLCIADLKLILDSLPDTLFVEPNAVGNLVVTDMYDNLYGHISFTEKRFCNHDIGE